MVLAITQENCLRIKRVLLDQDEAEPLRLVREFCKRMEQQQQRGLKSHLDGR